MAATDTRKLTISIDGDEVSPQLLSAIVSSGAKDSGDVTFEEARQGGGRQYTLKIKALQDLMAGTVWDQAWAHAGEDVDVIVRPYGNATPTPAQPHFRGTVTISEPDGDFFGTDADASTTARPTTDFEWIFTSKPTRVTA